MVVYLCKEIQYSNDKEETTVEHINIDGSHRCNFEQEDPDGKVYPIFYILYIATVNNLI